MASAEVDEAGTRPPRDGPTPRPALLPALAAATTALALVFILCCMTLLLHPSPSSTLPTNLVYPPFAEPAVKKAASIAAVTNTDEYTATGALGNGKFGRVVHGRHRDSHDDVVAIKSLIGDADRSYADGAAEVLTEATILAAAGGHPSVVALRAIAVHPSTGELSLVMEHAGSHTLFDELYRHRGGDPFPERDARRVMRRLLAGVQHMHSRGVVHRDIKLDNVLVSAGDGDDDDYLMNVKICDLGLAVPADAAKKGRAGAAGTLNYMAPEILAGNERYSEKVDMWSLGAVMAELLGGMPLFDVEKGDDAALLRVIFHVLGPPCPGHNDKVPTSVSDRSRLRYFFPKRRLSDEGFEVLRGLLSCDVDRRLSATNALRLPWFADVSEAPSVPAR